MPPTRPTYAFDVEGHTVVVEEGSTKTKLCLNIDGTIREYDMTVTEYLEYLKTHEKDTKTIVIDDIGVEFK